MKKEIAVAWVAALRSGQFKQAKECLKDAGGRYCCLGVLCTLAPETAGKFSDKSDHTGSVVFVHSGGNHEQSYPPATVREWSGLRSNSGRIMGVGDLATMNDDGTTFAQIADVIDKHWEDL